MFLNEDMYLNVSRSLYLYHFPYLYLYQLIKVDSKNIQNIFWKQVWLPETCIFCRILD